MFSAGSLCRTRSDARMVAGVVRSVKETLSSQFVENCKGVIERLTLKEEKMVWNRTTHIWYGITVGNQRGAGILFD